MRKEYVVHKTVCDSCGEEKYEGTAFSVNEGSWHTLFGEDLCYVCFMSIVDTLISERYISEEDYKTVKETLVKNQRYQNPFGRGSTATFELFKEYSIK
jgi:hypothetical protein